MIPVTITKQKVTYRQTGAQGAHTDKRLVTERRRENALELTWSTEGIQSQTHGPKPAVQQARTKVHISLRHATRSFIHIHTPVAVELYHSNWRVYTQMLRQ